jgi:hypothetical protein
MSDERRPKRKADAAALDAILQIKEQEEEIDREEKTDGAILEEQDAFAQPILFCGGSVALPKHFFVGEILDFLSKLDLVHSASLVFSVWCNASKDTILWSAKKLQVSMRFVEREHLVEFSQRMGERLVELSVIVMENLLDKYDLTDKTFEAISTNCRNLESFGYFFEGDYSAPRLSERGAISIIQNCPKLESLFLGVPSTAVSLHIRRFVKENGRLSHFALHHAIVDDEMDDPSDDDPSDDDPPDSSSDDDSSDSSSDDDSSDSSSDDDSSDSSSDDDSSDSSDSSSDDDSSDSSDEDSSDSSSDDDSSDDEEGPDEGEEPDLD